MPTFCEKMEQVVEVCIKAPKRDVLSPLILKWKYQVLKKRILLFKIVVHFNKSPSQNSTLLISDKDFDFNALMYSLISFKNKLKI